MPQTAAPDLEKAKRELEIQALREKTPLEVSKLNLEIDALSKSFRRTLATSVITAVVAVTVAGGGWFVDRMKTRDANREARLSKAWGNFGNTNLVTRIAAISDLLSSAGSGRGRKKSRRHPTGSPPTLCDPNRIGLRSAKSRARKDLPGPNILQR
jgi:hypothetical protein